MWRIFFLESLPANVLATLALQFVLGASLASFSKACFDRLTNLSDDDERSAVEILSEPSSCPRCARLLGWGELVPVLSWLTLGGKCRGCGTKISAFHPIFETVGGVAAVCVHLVFSGGESELSVSASLAAGGCANLFFFMLALCAATDWKTGYVWDLPAGLCSVAASAYFLISGMPEHVLFMFSVGWVCFLTSMTGSAGSGDAAPLSTGVAMAASLFGDPFSPPSLAAVSSFAFLVGASGIVLSAKQTANKTRKRNSWWGTKIALVPHVFFAFVTLTLYSKIF